MAGKIEISYCEIMSAPPAKVRVNRPVMWDVMLPEARDRWAVAALTKEVGRVVFMGWKEVRG